MASGYCVSMNPFHFLQVCQPRNLLPGSLLQENTHIPELLLQCETVIEEEARILVFGPSSWPELLKPMQFCKLLSSKGASVLIFGL